MNILSFIKGLGTKLLLVMVAFFLAACSTTASGIPPAPRNMMPIAPLAAELPPYQIQVGDVLEVKLLLNPELNEEVIVRPDGKISTSVTQNILAYGMTPDDLQAKLNEDYEEHLTNPEVAVIVRTFAPTKIYVLGEVNSPGEYISIGPNLTLLQALARAGGVKNSAETEKILLLRRGSAEEPQIYYADYDSATQGVDPAADVRLAAYDVVYVPRTAIAEAYMTYEQYVAQFIKPGLSVSASYLLNDDDD